MLQFKTYGLQCHWIVADCFWNINGIVYDDLLLDAEDHLEGWAGPF